MTWGVDRTRFRKESVMKTLTCCVQVCSHSTYLKSLEISWHCPCVVLVTLTCPATSRVADCQTSPSLSWEILLIVTWTSHCLVVNIQDKQNMSNSDYTVRRIPIYGTALDSSKFLVKPINTWSSLKHSKVVIYVQTRNIFWWGKSKPCKSCYYWLY